MSVDQVFEPGRRAGRLPAKTGPARRMGAVFLSIALVVTVTGCSRFLPGAKYISPYVANRGGHYYVGARCPVPYTEVGMFGFNPYPRVRDAAFFDDAAWRATSRGVTEFELFSTDQPGVTVVFDDGTRAYSTKVYLTIRSDYGNWFSLAVTLGEIGDGMVSSGSTAGSWEKYKQIPDGDFMC